MTRLPAEITRHAPSLERLALALGCGGPEGRETAARLAACVLEGAATACAGTSGERLRARLLARLIASNRLVTDLAPSIAANAGTGRHASERLAPERLASERLASGEALARLPLASREALVLVVLAGLSYSGAAAILRVDREALANCVADARIRMADMCEGLSLGQGDGPPSRTRHLRLVK